MRIPRITSFSEVNDVARTHEQPLWANTIKTALKRARGHERPMEARSPAPRETTPGGGWHVSPEAGEFAGASRSRRFWMRYLLPAIVIALLAFVSLRIADHLIEARKIALNTAQEQLDFATKLLAESLGTVKGDGEEPLPAAAGWRTAISDTAWAFRKARFKAVLLVGPGDEAKAEFPPGRRIGKPLNDILANYRTPITSDRRLPDGKRIVAIAEQGDFLGLWFRELVLFVALLLIGVVGFGVILWLFIRNTRRHWALLRSAEMFRNDMEIALHEGRAGLWFWDIVRGELTISSSVFTSLGLEAPEGPLPFSRLRGLLHPEDDLYGALTQRIRAGAEEFSSNFRMTDADGKWVWFELRGRILQGNWQAAPNFLGVILEIPGDRRRESHDAELATRLIDAVDADQHSFVLWDENDRLVMCNRRFQEIYKLGASDARPGTSFTALRTAAGDRLVQGPRTFGGTPKPKSGTYEADLRDGRWLHVSEHRTRNGDFISIATDITELKQSQQRLAQSERELKATVLDLQDSRQKLQVQTKQLVELADKYAVEKARAEEASKAKSEFLANISHELRTPLNAIIGFSEVMTEQFFGDLGHHKYLDYAKDILKSGRYLLEMIDDILDMSKIEAGQLALSIEPLSIGELIEDSLRVVRPSAEERDIQLHQSGNRNIKLEGDRRALKQVLLNLLSNAVKFTPEGGEINVRSYRYKGTVRVAISDTGIGIPRHEISKLGRPFQQVGNQLTKGHKGSGLGLAISRTIVEMHDGRLDIKSKIGEGTTVTCVLPQHLETAPPPQMSNGNAASAPPAE